MAEAKPVKGPMGRPPRGVKPQVENPGKIFVRIMKYVLKNYTPHCIIAVVSIFVSVLANVQGTMFMKTLIDSYIMPMLKASDPDFTPLLHAILRVAVFYLIGILATFAQNRVMIYVTQGTLRNLRNDLFAHMEKLPIKYFDTHSHGDIMSIYTNDIDTLRQMISQSIPQVLNSAITIVSVFVSMLILNIPLTITTLIMVAIMMTVTKKVAGLSGNFFVKQQKALGEANGFIEEMMDGPEGCQSLLSRGREHQEIQGAQRQSLRQLLQCERFRQHPGPDQRPAGKCKLCGLRYRRRYSGPEQRGRLHLGWTGQLPDLQ